MTEHEIKARIFSIFAKCLSPKQLEALQKIILNQASKPEIAGAILHGSWVSNKKGHNDVDLLFLRSGPPGIYKQITRMGVKIDMDFRPLGFYFSFINKYFYFPENWEYEAAKIVKGIVLFDKYRSIAEIRKQLESFPLRIREFLFLYRAGEALGLYSKLINFPSDNRRLLETQIYRYLNLLNSCVEKKFPLDFFEMYAPLKVAIDKLHHWIIEKTKKFNAETGLLKRLKKGKIHLLHPSMLAATIFLNEKFRLGLKESKLAVRRYE